MCELSNGGGGIAYPTRRISSRLKISFHAHGVVTNLFNWENGDLASGNIDGTIFSRALIFVCSINCRWGNPGSSIKGIFDSILLDILIIFPIPSLSANSCPFHLLPSI